MHSAGWQYFHFAGKDWAMIVGICIVCEADGRTHISLIINNSFCITHSNSTSSINSLLKPAQDWKFSLGFWPQCKSVALWGRFWSSFWSQEISTHHPSQIPFWPPVAPEELSFKILLSDTTISSRLLFLQRNSRDVNENCLYLPVYLSFLFAYSNWLGWK